MQVDIIALLQGVGDAHANREISSTLANQIYEAVSKVSFSGPVGRKVCNYGELLVILASIKSPNPYELARLWRRLGESLASGVEVAANCREEAQG